MATKIANLITLDGTFMDWPAADMVMTSANTATGYQVYGAFLNDATLGNTYVIGIDATASTDPVIGAGTIIYLNTDQNDTTGYNLSWANVGAEYEVQFALDGTGALQAYLYSVTSAGATTLLNGGAPLNAGFSSDGLSVELAVPQALLTPAGGAAPTSINFATLNGAVGLPGDLANNPEYIITDPAAVVPTTTIGNLITLDGTFADWPAADIVTTPANVAPGYQIYGAFLNDATLGNTYVIGIDATAATDPVIAAGTTVYLNTDQNNTTGYNLSFANIGAEYEVQFAYGSNAELQPFLYSVTSAGVTTLLNGGAPLHAGFSSNGESVELAIPQALLTPTGGAAPTSINFVTLNGAQGLPSNLAGSPEYTITDSAPLLPKTATHRVAIVYSDTTAALYFRSLGDAPGTPSTAYSDLFMAAQNQARMAGVSYDVIDESQLTNINNLIGYDAIIFPAMADVNTAQLPAIMSTLTSAVYNYHISLITSGDFLTNDQTGAALPGNAYANMETLLGLQRVSGGNSGTVTVTANDVSNPIMSGYTAGQTIQTFSNEGYTSYSGVGGVTPDVLVNQNVTDPTLPGGSETIPGVVETTTGGTNVEFSSQDLLGDNNLLSHVIQSVVLGTQPGVALHMSRDAGVVAVRMDMDQSQFPSDVTPTVNGVQLPASQGIYGTLIPILQQWNQQYDFVGSYYINIGDNPTAADPSTTNWAASLPYYQALQAMGSEIGTHTYTHLINPPTATFTAVTSADSPAGSTQITLTGPPPSFYGITVGMWLSGTGIGSNTPLPGTLGEGGALANTQVTAVNGNTITVSYVPAGFGGANQGTLGDVPAGTTLTFSIPPENTNFLEPVTGTNLSGTGNPFTFAYEFGLSKTTEQTNLGTTIYGAAVPGAAETYATAQNILPYFQSVAPTATTPGYTGYVTGGWTGIGSGYPSAIGYMSPSATDLGSLYIAPNMTFDFTEIQYEGKTVAQAEADWAAQFSALTANAAGTPVVVLPIHDYGVAAWNTNTDTVNDPTTNPNYYTTQMYASFIAQAYNAGYEFLTLEELAARTEAQQKASVNYTTVGNAITATVTPDPTAPDVGGMALDVVNGGTDVIQNVTNWYAYNAQELFLPTHGGTFTINLGTTQDAVTHIASLPMRGDLLSVTGNGLNLSFAMVGTGQVIIDLANTTVAPIVTGATVVSLVGNQLDLSLTSTGENDVSITLAAPPTISGTVAGQATTDLATVAPFSGVTIADTNANQTETVTVTLSAAANGTLSNLGTGTYDATTGVYTATGTAAAVTAALDGLVFTPTANEVAPGQTVTTIFTISDKDTAGLTTTDSTTTVVATDVAVPPTISGTAAGQTTTDLVTIAPFSKVTIADLNIGQTETVTITPSAVANGTLTNLGGFTYSAATGAYTDTGTAAAVTAALDALVFVPTVNQVAPGQTVTTSFTITDTNTAVLTATDSTTTVVATDVAVPPTISGTVAGQATADLATIAPFSKVTIADTNAGQTETVTVTLSAVANGTLTNLGGFTYSTATGAYTDTGTAAAVTAALDALVFVPTANQVAPGQTVTTSFTITDTNTAALTATDSTTTVVATDVGVPTLTVPSSATVNQGTATSIAGLSLAEVGNVAGESFTVALTDTNGNLSATGAGVSGSGTPTLTISGSLAAVNGVLATLSDADAKTPTDTITVNAVDSFGVAAAPQSIAVTVTPAPPQTYTLTTGTDTVAGGPGNNTIVAKTNTLNATDNINGGTGTNTLQLVGGGTFNLAAPATLTNIAIVTAQEGAGTTAQKVTLRAGLNATVNVASDTAGDASPGITIVGAANSDVINLGSGNDTVTLGAGETANSGGGNNTFKVASASLGSVTINGGTQGTNTLNITGGGTAIMGAGITGISTGQLASATTFTANATAGLKIIGSGGADYITAGGAGQVLTGGAGADTLTGSSAGNDIFRDTAAGLNGDTIVNRVASDVIDITDLAPATTVISRIIVSATSTVLTLTSGTTSTKVTLSGLYEGSFALAADSSGGGGTDLTFVPSTTGSTIILPATPVTINTGPVSTTIIATAATLLPADSITGGTGTGVSNTLVLSGGGAFNLAALTKLTNMQVITAQEGQGPTVTLRNNLNATVNVTPDAAGGITIIGATNADVINLGAGNDTVTLGSGETVNGGTGNDTYNVTSATIGNVTIKGGSGSNTLVVNGGGTAAMGTKIVGINAVQLATTTKFTANTTAGLQISGSSAGGDTITLGAPTQSVIAGGPNEIVRATAANAGASISGLGANSTLQITSGGTIALNAATDVATVKLSAASTLLLNKMSFITAIGSGGNDTIQAAASNQTLTGGAGADTLIGFSGGSDMFRDTAANLNGDTIKGFVASDTIDLTNLAFVGATVTAVASALTNTTKVTVASGLTKSTFTMAGSWASSGFSLASDGVAGTLLMHT